MNDITQEFRNCCGRFATGVTVVCSGTGEDPHGMTVNGFMSVSLDPRLLVVSIGRHQKMHEIISTAKKFSVNILGESQVEISDHFAGKYTPGVEVEFESFDGVPLLQKKLAFFIAEVISMHLEGDHALYVGKVTHFEQSSDELPLLFYGGRYAPIDTKTQF